jgi:NADPH-dependent 7-cyano-7-deazaguanine reductase QueF
VLPEHRNYLLIGSRGGVYSSDQLRGLFGHASRGWLIESKALKLYLWGFRHKGIFAEDLAATLLKDLVGACDPQEMTVDLMQQVRGGLKIRTVVRHQREE